MTTRAKCKPSRRPLKIRSPRGFLVGFSRHAFKRLTERKIDADHVVEVLDRFEPIDFRRTDDQFRRTTEQGIKIIAKGTPDGWTVITVYRA